MDDLVDQYTPFSTLCALRTITAPRPTAFSSSLGVVQVTPSSLRPSGHRHAPKTHCSRQRQCLHPQCGHYHLKGQGEPAGIHLRSGGCQDPYDGARRQTEEALCMLRQLADVTRRSYQVRSAFSISAGKCKTRQSCLSKEGR